MLNKNNHSILEELQNFISSVNSFRVTGSQQPPIKSSLILLSNLPATRNIVFDSFSVMFDLSVAQYISSSDRNEENNEDNEKIQEIQDALEDLIRHGAKAWPPLISNWSLNLLGKLSDKHSRRSMDIGSACSLWLASSAMRCLLGIAALCFEKLDSFETEECIGNLLNTFVKYSPHFDWVVARLGGCFPFKVISKVLQCGLKEFSSNQKNLLDSEIGILGYLSCSHEKELKFALKEMVEDVRVGDNNQLKDVTFPYILHLAEMSDVLSQTIVGIFIEMFDDKFATLVQRQFKRWPSNWNISNVIPILSNLMLKTSTNGTLLLLLLTSRAYEYDWCKELLELVLVELESKIADDVPPPILKDLIKNDSKKELWQKCFSDDPLLQQVAIRILLLCSSRTPSIYCQTISHLLTSNTNVAKTLIVNSLKRITSLPFGVDNMDIRNGIFLAIQRILLHIHRGKDNSIVFLKNFLSIVKVEKSAAQSPLNRKNIFAAATISSISTILLIWKETISNTTEEFLKPPELNTCLMPSQSKRFKSEYVSNSSNDEVYNFPCNEIHLIADLIESLDLGSQNSLKLSDELLLIQLIVKYFFLCLIDFKTRKSYQRVQRCYILLSRQCVGRKSSQSVALRELLEGALFTHRHLFGSQLDDEPFLKKSEDLSLLRANQEQEASMMTCRSLVLHAGIIGAGMKLPRPDADGPQANIKNLFMNAIDACCAETELPAKIDGYNHLSLLLIEYLSTDVMYNGLIWPEEDFTKVTMERDLQIRRAFLDNPIIWCILSLVATCRPSLCICSVLLRALCASVLHQWRANSGENINSSNNADIMQVTIRLLKLLSMSQMLPPPLDYLYIVIEYLEPPEIAYLMKECVWNFMRDFVPSPMLFGCDISGLHWRDPTVARPPAKFIDPLRNTMLKKIKLFGHLFYQMFSMSELRNP